MTLNKIAQTRVRVGQKLECLYPKHGRRNILCKQAGEVTEDGFSENGHWYTIKRPDGSYRRLSLNKMVSPQVSNG